MEFLDNSPSLGLEVLSLGYTITSATSLWNWLAVVIAAIGFWRIRAFAAFINSDKPPTPPAAIDKDHPQPPKPKMESLSSSPPMIGSQPVISLLRNADSKSDCHVAVCHKSAVFEAFDCSWCVQEEEDHGEDEEDGEGEVVDADCVCEEEGEEKKKPTMAVARLFTRGDLGWYRYQDPRAINGNVIRLWEDHHHRRRRPSPSGKLLRRYWSM